MAPCIVEPKSGVSVGRVIVSVAVENYADRLRCERGEIPADEIRRLDVQALVDTGATFFCLPDSVIAQLGLPFVRTRETRTVSGRLTLPIYAASRIEVLGRSCVAEVLGLPNGRQALLGQIPLETLDWWVDTTNQRLVGNPEHDGEWMADAF